MRDECQRAARYLHHLVPLGREQGAAIAEVIVMFLLLLCLCALCAPKAHLLSAPTPTTNPQARASL
jgi:hypothetical protein